MDKKVLLTGGTGFVGYWMRMTKPDNVLLSAIDKMRYETGQWKWQKYDYIVHLANVSPKEVLEKQCRVLYCSSGAIYEGINKYADDKRLWEFDCLESGQDVVIARLFTFSGEKLKNLYALTKFIEAAKKGKAMEVWGDGSTIRSYLYGEDLGRWMWKILFEGEGIYDVGSDIPYTILNVARMVQEFTGAKIYLVDDIAPTVYLPDTDKVYELGCRETVGLREAIERMLK